MASFKHLLASIFTRHAIADDSHLHVARRRRSHQCFRPQVDTLESRVCLSVSFAPTVHYEVTGTTLQGVTFADLNGDGSQDLVAVNFDQARVSVHLNEGDGTFAAPVYFGVGGGPCFVVADDLDGDGDIDIVTANDSTHDVSVLFNNGNGTFASATNFATFGRSYSVTTADLDDDGDLDLAVANHFSSATLAILFNDGSGAFTAPIIYSTGVDARGVAAADLDGDGDLDLAVPNMGGEVSILLNNEDGFFASTVNLPLIGGPIFVRADDLDGDGDIDLAIPNRFSAEVSILLNKGDGTFAAPVRFSVEGTPLFMTSADLDMDGDVDLAVSASSNVLVLINNGLGAFTVALSIPVIAPGGITSGDFNSDGVPDIAVGSDPLYAGSSDPSSLVVLINTTVPPVQHVDIDIKPGSDPNSINLASQGVIPIALFGSATFDVTTVNIGSVLFAGANVAHYSWNDVNNDGHMDLMLQFRTEDTYLRDLYAQLLADADTNTDGILDDNVSTWQTTSVSLTGTLSNGGKFSGADSVDLFLSGKALRDFLAELAGLGMI
jgi:hypothetical protein